MANREGAPDGNKNAVKRSRLVTDTLRKVAVQNPAKLRAACEALLDKAANGDAVAFKEIRDTLDGKTANVSIEHTGTVAHEHIAVPEATRRIAELLADGTETASPPSLPH